MKNKFKALVALTIVLILVTSVFLAGCAAEPRAPQVTDSATQRPQSAAPSASEQADELSYVSIDINPSIELTLINGTVAQAKAYNDDGAAIILSNDVVGMTPGEAVSSLVGSFASEGYITSENDDAAIVITVAGGQDEELAESLKQNAEQSLDSLGLKGSIVSANVADEIVQTANSFGLSIGRYLLLKQIASEQGIMLEEAKDKYGAVKMSELLKMIEDLDKFMEDIQQAGTSPDSLTPEQQQILTAAREAFRTAMKTAQQAFLGARTQAKKDFMASRDGAKDAFLKGKDNDALKAAKKQIKDAFALAKKTATDAMKQAKIKAREDFMAAIAGLGLSEEAAERLIEWNADMDFDIDVSLDFEVADDSDKDENVGRNDEDDGNKDKDNKDDKDKHAGQDKGGKGKSKPKGDNPKKLIVGDDSDVDKD